MFNKRKTHDFVARWIPIIGLVFFLFSGTLSSSSSQVVITPVPGAITNLLTNGDFETSDLSQWQGETKITIDASDPHEGTYAAHVTQASAWHQGWITVTP